MQASKNLAVMFLLGAVLVGGALGFSADRVIVGERICGAKSGPKDMRKMFADRLELSGPQEAKIDSLLDDRHRQIRMVMATVKEQLDSVRARSAEQIDLILNTEQRQRFHQLLAEVNDPTRSRDKDR
jgi:Spy/CpxP family protein refolding chaperone